MKPFPLRFALAAGACLALVFSAAIRADDEPPRAVGQAPPNHVATGDGPAGTYYVNKALKQRLDQAIDNLQKLSRNIDDNHVPTEIEQQEIIRLTAELAALRGEIEQAKVHVPAGTLHTRTDSTTLELGPRRLLLITADQVRVVGWEQPGVKCVLEKTIITTGDEPVDEQFAAVKVVHQHGKADDKVGKTLQQRRDDEIAFQLSDAGKSMAPAGSATRDRLLQQIAEGYAIYRDFQGQEIDSIEVTGLAGDQGNRSIVLETKSVGGGANHRSVRQRRALLTIYVPRCQAIAIRGGLAGLDVDNIDGPLLLTSRGDRDYQATYRVQNVRGSVTARNYPLQTAANIAGDLSVEATLEFANAGTQHRDDRKFAFYAPLEFNYRNIQGNLHVRLGRAKLTVADIGGAIDVHNEYGDTTLTLGKPLAQAAHRVVSESGRIDVRLTPPAIGEMPLVAATNYGSVRTNLAQQAFEHFMVTSPENVSLRNDEDALERIDRATRSWSGFAHMPPAGQGDFLPEGMRAAERALQAWRGATDSPPGLDLVSRAGTVTVNEDR